MEWLKISGYERITMRKLVEHLRIPLYRNGYALVASSALTSALGFLYWMIAARSYSTEVVGLNSAALSAMLFLANIAVLNLNNALNRFLPDSGVHAKRMVLISYLFSVGFALITSGVFLSGLSLWSPSLVFLRNSQFSSFWFVISTMAWCIFLLQDSAMTGLKQAIWVPLENTTFSVTKIVLLLAFAALLPQVGIIVSWTGAMAVMLVPVNLLIFGRLIPRYIRQRAGLTKPLELRKVVRYVAGNYAASLVWMGTVSLMPIVVVEKLGADANAYYYLAWTIAYSLYLVSRNMGMALIAEGSMNQYQVNSFTYRTYVQTMRLVLPAVALAVFGAPIILRLFGENYAAEGVLVLRLLSLSAIPYALVSLYQSALRIRMKVGMLIITQTTLCILVVGIGIPLMHVRGIEGLGWAWLLAQTAMAIVVLITNLWRAWLPYVEIQLILRIFSLPRKYLGKRRQRAHITAAKRVLHMILARVPAQPGFPPPAEWAIYEVISTVGDTTVALLRPRYGPAAAFLKLPRSPNAVNSLERQSWILSRLSDDERLGEWRSLLPSVLVEDAIDGQRFTIERALPGVQGRSRLFNEDCRIAMLEEASSALSPLHLGTAEARTVGADLLELWVDRPSSVIRETISFRSNGTALCSSLDRIAKRLRESLGGQTFPVSWCHGDFVPANILFSQDSGKVSGIVDWDLGGPNSLPLLDIMWLLIATRMEYQRRELGDVVRDLLEGDNWADGERTLLDRSSGALSCRLVENETMVLLCWLRHISGMLTKSERYQNHWLWIPKNLEGVLYSA